MMVKFIQLVQMIKQRGFTLLELLIVLGITSILLLLAVPITFNKLNEMEEKQFLNMFKHDVLYTQSLALSSFDDQVRLRIQDDYYEILSGNVNEVKTIRKIPSGWHFNTRTINDIAFKNSGTIRKAGTITVTTPHSTYDIVFPPGKGRCYIVKK